jgi:hypothetical protein
MTPTRIRSSNLAHNLARCGVAGAEGKPAALLSAYGAQRHYGEFLAGAFLVR